MSKHNATKKYILAFTRLHGGYSQAWGMMLARGRVSSDKWRVLTLRYREMWSTYEKAIGANQEWRFASAYQLLRRLYLDLLAILDSYESPVNRDEPGRKVFDTY